MKTMIVLMLTVLPFFCLKGFAQDKPAMAENKPAMPARVNGPVAKWDKTVEDMGDIPQGIPRVAGFTLTNEGNEPLLISSAQASCGCTNLSYSKEPLLPGRSTPITATYNAASKGSFMKTVTVRTNAGDQPTVLQIKGNVVQEKPAGQ